MIDSENALPILHTFAHGVCSFHSSALPFPREGWIAHAGQRVDGPLLASSCESPSLAPPALPLPPTGLRSRAMTPDWPCWSAWKRAPLPASSCGSPSLARSHRSVSKYKAYLYFFGV